MRSRVKISVESFGFSLLLVHPNHMLQILLVLVANVFQELCVRNQVSVLLEAPRLGVDLRVDYRELNLQMAKVPPPEAFDDMESVAVKPAVGKNRFGVVEARGIGY